MATSLTEKEIKNWKRKINAMGHEEMARHWRFADSGDPNHPYFDIKNPELVQHFDERFKSLGGWDPSLSKKIGWEKP